MELTKEYIEENGLTYAWMAKKDTNFELVSDELYDYNEGCVTTNYIFKTKEEPIRYFSFFEASNSWDEGYDYSEDDNEPVEVFPVEVTVTKYLTQEEIDKG